MTTELRFAFALNGGVSLSIWIGGVTDEVLRCVNGGRLAAEGSASATNPYAALCAELDVLPKADVLTGTSAGGLNAAFLGAAVTHGCTDLQPIRALWLEHGSFDRLMRATSDQSLESLLNGDEHFLPYIEQALRDLAAAGTGYRPADPPVVVRLTGTSLPGRLSTLTDGHGSVSSVDHRVEFIFHNADFDFDADPGAVPRMARACRSSASFPGAFEPSTVPGKLFEGHHVWGLFEDGDATPVPLIDGGLLVNLPAQAALDAIIRQPSRERVERVLALVVPDPGDVPDTGAIESPSLGQVISKTLVGIPLTQSLTDFIRVLNEHNLEVRARRSAREALLVELADLAPADAWAVVSRLGTSLFPAYRAMRMTSSLDRTRFVLHAGLRQAARAAGLNDLREVDASMVPWVPDKLSVGDATWCWGSSAVRRLSSMIITWINLVVERVPDGPAGDASRQALRDIKDDISRARSRAEQLAPSAGVIQDLMAQELAADPTSVASAFERACGRWPVGDPARASEAIGELNGALLDLAAGFERFVDVARPLVAESGAAARDKTSASLRGVVRLAEGAAGDPSGLAGMLLCLEVLEASFAGIEPRPDQEVQLVQFTSSGAVSIDDLRRSDPYEKLAGIELAHFGGFLKGSWRANDWMWGRLDAAQRLLLLLDSTCGHRLSAAGTLDDHTRRVQATILREELPTVVDAIERDGQLGARVSSEARAFCTAVRSLVGATTGPVDLTAATDDQLRELLALELVGTEDVGQEAGSNLATVTSISAMSTASRVIQSQGPGVLRGPARMLGASSSFAWRVTKRGPGINLQKALVALIVATTLVGLVGAFLGLLTDLDLGAWRYVAWVCLVLAPVLVVFAVPWLLLGVGRRKMGRGVAQPPG